MAVEEYRGVIDRLRKLVGDSLPPDYNNDYDLYRWAKGWQGKVEEILPRIHKHVAIRKGFHLDDGGFPEFEQGSFEDRLYTDLAKSFGISQLSPDWRDKDGNLVTVMKMGGVDVAEVANQVRCRDFLWFCSAWGDMNRRVTLEAEQVAEKPLGITVIMDLDGINVTKLAVDCFRGAPKISLQMAQEHYPEQTTKMLFVNIPAAVEIVVTAAKPFLYEETRQKMIFLNGDHKERLLEHIDHEHLPVEYGGSKDIAVPSPCPQSLNAEGLYSDQRLPGELRTLHIKPKATVLMATPLDRVPGKGPLQLEWYFETNSEMIFGIEVKPFDSTKWVEIIPKLPIVTSPVPDFGSIEINEDDFELVRLSFTNQSTVLFSAKVKYRATLRRFDGDEQIALTP